MKQYRTFLLLTVLSLVLVQGVQAGGDRANVYPVRQLIDRPEFTSLTSYAKTDTVYIYGAPGTLEGAFQTAGGAPDAQGWTSVDLSGSGVGNFGVLRLSASELVESLSGVVNKSPRWTFVDDGLSEPTGGAPGLTWVYGPYGYVVNAYGGLAGTDHHIINEIWSPILPWPSDGFRAGVLKFDAYLHEHLGPTSPGMFLRCRVRSTSSATSADILAEPWRDRGVVYYGGPDEYRVETVITDLLDRAPTYVQVAIGVHQLGYLWGATGFDATPAPYIDNVTVGTHLVPDPTVSALAVTLPQDAFPENGYLDLVDLGANNVRFDAPGISPGVSKTDVPADSVYINISNGLLDLAEAPLFHYTVRQNSTFDDYRDSGTPATGAIELSNGTGRSGSAPGDSTYSWRVDMSDDGFLYPGDILHCYVEVTDTGGHKSYLPEDRSAYGIFPGDPDYQPFAYPPEFTLRALPSLTDAPVLHHPPILLWFDTGCTKEMQVWQVSLANLGLVEQVDYDIYYTNAAASGLSNGLYRTTAAQLTGYETIIYTSGDDPVFTISSDADQAPGDDLTVLRGWLGLGNKNLLIVGDHTANDLYSQGTSGRAFLSERAGIDTAFWDAAPAVSGQVAPRVAPVPGNAVFTSVDRWMAFAVPAGVTFDGVTPEAGAQVLAEFLAPDGSTGVYNVAAAILNLHVPTNAQVLTIPYAFKHIYTQVWDDKAAASLAARTRLLGDILIYFGHTMHPLQATDVPFVALFTAHSYPNPCNPRLNIAYEMSRPGRLSIEIFDLAGRRVCVLHDGAAPAGPGLSIWNGEDQAGRAQASGLYFWRARAHGESLVQKVSLVR